MSEAVASGSAPAAPAAQTPEVVDNTAATAPAGETPEAVGEKTPAPASETPAKTDEDSAKSDRARHRRQLSTAYRKAAEAQARAEFFEKQLNEAKAKAAPAADPGEPKLEDFKSIEEYGAAVKKYASEKSLKEHTDKQRAESQKREMAELEKSWSEKAEKGAEKYDDWDEIVGEIKPNAPWVVAAMEADNAADVMYHLGKDDAKEAKRIMALPPRSQIREVGKIEAKLAAEPPKPKTPSRAPAPITPVTAAAAPATKSLSDPELSYEDFVKIRNKQLGRTR